MGLILQHYLYFFSSYPNLLSGYDADMIISAQWNIFSQEAPGQGIYVATTNIKHLKIFVGEFAQYWRDIKF